MNLLQPGRRIHVFWRTKSKAKFKYAGLAQALEVFERPPVEVLWSFDTPEELRFATPVTNPEELPTSTYLEGAVHKVWANRYERDPAARKACIAYHGEACVVCDISV